MNENDRLKVALISAIRCAGRVTERGIEFVAPQTTTAGGWPAATLESEPFQDSTLWRVVPLGPPGEERETCEPN